MRYTPFRFKAGDNVKVNGTDGKVQRHRTDAQVTVKLASGKVVIVEARDIKKKG